MRTNESATSEAKDHSLEAPLEAGCRWSRLPKLGQVEPLSGLNRSAINSLILGKEPKVKSTTLRRHPEAKRAVRLVKILGAGSLLEFLEAPK